MGGSYPLESGWERAPEFVQTPRLEAAQFIIAASRLEQVDEVVVPVAKTHEEINHDLYEALQEKYWFLQPAYRNREPNDQWFITIGDHATAVYNFAPEVRLGGDQVTVMAVTMAQFAATFPDYAPSPDAITVTDQFPPSFYGDPIKFPTQGEAQPLANMFALAPRSLDYRQADYRPELPVSRLRAVIIHELAHFYMDEVLEKLWQEAGFTWKEMISDDDKPRYRSNQPWSCVTSYGDIGGIYDDIADSVVAYLMHPFRLDDAKRTLIGLCEKSLSVPDWHLSRVINPRLPKLPEEISYYLDNDNPDEIEE